MKIKGKIILHILVFSLISFLAVFILINKSIFYSNNFSNFIEDIKNRKNKPKNSTIDIGEITPNNFMKFGDDLSVISKSKFVVLSSKLQKLLEINHSFQYPVVKNSNFKSLIFDSDGTNFIVTTKSKELSNLSLEQKIITGDISDRDNLVLVTESDEYCCEMKVLSINGEDKYQYCFSKLYVSDVAINNSGDKVAICGIQSDGEKTKSVIQIFDIKSESALFIKEFENNVFFSIDFFDDKNLVAIGDKLSISMQNLGQKTKEFEYPKDSLCLSSFDKNSGIALSFSSTHDERNQYIVMLDKNCQQTAKIETGKRLKSIVREKNKVTAISESQLLILSSGKFQKQKIHSKRVPISCQKAIPISNSKCFLLGSSEIFVIKSR